jgi:hypothetical protein
MRDDSKLPPKWLLDEVGLLDGVFIEGRTVIVGRPDAHNSTVLNVGSGPPATVRVDLKKRVGWEAIQKRLTDEGF